jgi:ketosteroid isomerase-like protein
VNQQALDAAEKLFTAIEAGDVAAIRALYSPDVKVWHNTDNLAQSVDENLAVLKWVTTHITNLKYTEVRRQPTPTGFVQQHVLRGRFGDNDVALPACIVATVVDGRITRIDEYLDSAQTAVLRGR